MLRATALLSIAAGLAMSGVARADHRLVAESRHPTAKERRAALEKLEAQMEKEGYRPLPRIVGGRPAADGEYPWMVGLIDAGEVDEFDGFFCGASLVHPYWVLTAAHCVLGSRAEDIEVLAGTNDLSHPGAESRRIAVSEIILSPTYNDFTMDADFALLRLAEPAAGTVIPLIDDSDLALPGVEATVTGWGDTTNGEGSYPNRLQEVELPIVDLAVANATPAYDGTLTANMLAAGLAEGGKDSCQGDSGGPLIVPSPRAPGWAQAGVVSFGTGCAEPGAYGIYTKIANFRDFITGHIRPNYAAWERANGRRGESVDMDGNGRGNFEEWALPHGEEVTTNVAGSFFFVRYLRPYDAAEATFILEQAASPAGPWSTAGQHLFYMERLNDGLAHAVHRFPLSAISSSFRVRAEFSPHLAHGDRPSSFPGAATGQLGALDRVSSSRSYQTYALDFPSGAGPVGISLRSRDFKAALKLQALGSGGGIVDIDADAGIGAGGTDERYEFTPEEGRSYRIWVTTTDGEESGAFELNSFDPAAFQAQPTLAVPLAKPAAGALTTADLPDPFFLPGGTFYKDDYRLDTSSLPQGRLLELRMTSAGRAAKAIDDFLMLIDAESGRLIAGNDNFAGRKDDAGLRFIPVPGRSYLLRASSGEERDIGNYKLAATSPVAGAKRSPLGAIGIGAAAKGALSAASEIDERYFTFKCDYLLAPVSGDQQVTVTLESVRFDAYLMVLDASDLTVVTTGDVGGPPGGRDNAKAEFTARAGCRYVIRATTYDMNEKGPFVLKTTTP